MPEPQFDLVAPLKLYVPGGHITPTIRRETMGAARVLEIITSHQTFNGALKKVQEFVQSQPQPGTCLELNAAGYMLLIYCVFGE